MPRIGIFAPSSTVPQIELKLGIEKLSSVGDFEVVVHPSCKNKHLWFAGNHQERTQAFIDLAQDPTIDVLWCARAGYGSYHLLEALSELDAPAKKKLLIGFSDATSLMEFVRSRWNWSILHAPMPATASIHLTSGKDWKTLVQWVLQTFETPTWEGKKLERITKPGSGVDGTCIGGNLSLWASMMGTPYQPTGSGKILFFEEIAETPSRMDRMVCQIRLAGGFDGIEGILLGDFLNCDDRVPEFLKARPKTEASFKKFLKAPRKSQIKPIRARVSHKKAIQEIFGNLGEHLGVPVWSGFPTGHGPRYAPLPLGSRLSIGTNDSIRLQGWDWISGLPNSGGGLSRPASESPQSIP